MRLALLAPLALLAACASSNPSRPESPGWDSPPPRPAPMGEAPAGEAQASPEPEPAASADAVAAGPAAPPAEPLVARVGQREIGVSRLLAAWMNANSREVSALLESVVTAAAVELEAARLRIELDPVVVERDYQELVAALEADVQQRNPGGTLDEWVRLELGLDPAGYRAGLREDARLKLLGERLVRTFTLSHERARVRVIVTQTREQMQAVQDALAAGRSFEELARERSVDPSGKAGGRIPPILRNETRLSRLAFLTGAGEVGGPIEVAEAGRWLLVAVEALEPPIEGSWREIQPAVEQSLAEEPLQENEYMQWRIELTRRYQVDLEPFFRLVDGAR